MPDFPFDVFLSHSSADKAAVRKIAERLRDDGLRVWFDEWEVRARSNISLEIEKGLEKSRVMLFCVSANTVGPEWVQWERRTALFRDPSNRGRRFVALRLDDTPLEGALARYKAIDWFKASPDEYVKLLDACRAPQHLSSGAQEPAARHRTWLVKLRWARLVRLCADSEWQTTLAGGEGGLLQLRDTNNGSLLVSLEGDGADVGSVAWSPDERLALSASSDQTVRLGNTRSGRCLRVFSRAY